MATKIETRKISAASTETLSRRIRPRRTSAWGTRRPRRFWRTCRSCAAAGRSGIWPLIWRGRSHISSRQSVKEGDMDGMTLFFVLVGALTVAVQFMHLIDRLKDGGDERQEKRLSEGVLRGQQAVFCRVPQGKFRADRQVCQRILPGESAPVCGGTAVFARGPACVWAGHRPP